MNKSIKELLVLHFLNDGIRTTFVSMLPFIAKDLSFSLASVGFLGSAQPLLASILALPTGFVAARIGGFHLLTTLLLVYSAGAVITAFSQSFLTVVGAFMLGALGFGMFHTVGFSLVAKNSKDTNIGQNMGEFTSVGDIGRVLIPPLAVFLAGLFGWRVAMLILATFGLLSFAILHFVKPKETYGIEGKKLDKETHKDFLIHLTRLLKDKKLLLIMTTAIIDSLASGAIYIFLPFLLFAKGVNVAQYGIAIAMFFAGSLFGKIVLGRGVDKIGNVKVFIFSEVLMAITLLLLTFFSHYLILLLFSFLLGFFTKGTSPVVQTMFSQVAKKIHYNKIYALSELSIGVSALIAIVLMGVIADRIGIVFVFYTACVFALLAIFPALFLSKMEKEIDNFVILNK